jgi:hypothetical protein
MAGAAGGLAAPPTAPEFRNPETHLDVSLSAAGRNDHVALAVRRVFPGLLALAAAGTLGLATWWPACGAAGHV